MGGDAPHGTRRLPVAAVGNRTTFGRSSANPPIFPVIRKILPPNVSATVATPDMWEEAVADEKETFIAKAVLKRQREFRAGRCCAHHALVRLGSRDAPILVGERRQSLWPTGYVGSITHTDGYSAAAVALQTDCSALGINVEDNLPLQPRVFDRIVTPGEKERHRAILDEPSIPLGKILFSAKESSYKAFYPVHGVFLGFQEAELTVDIAAGTFSAEIRQREQAIHRCYTDRFAYDGQYVYTAVVDPPPPAHGDAQ